MTSATLAPVTDGDATLRPLAESDLPATLSWRNHPDSAPWFHSTEKIDEVQHREWYAGYLTRDDDFVFVLDVSGTPAGQAALYAVADGTAEFGRLLIDPAKRGRGLSHRAIALTLRVADEQLALERVRLEVKRDNARAIRGYLAAGFHDDDSLVGHAGSVVMERVRP